MTSDLSLWKLRHGFYSSAVLQMGCHCSGLSWILGSRWMQRGSGPSPASLPLYPEKTGSGPQAASKGDTVESISKVKLLFPLVLGWLWGQGLTISRLSQVWVRIPWGYEVEKTLWFCSCLPLVHGGEGDWALLLPSDALRPCPSLSAGL